MLLMLVFLFRVKKPVTISITIPQTNIHSGTVKYRLMLMDLSFESKVVSKRYGVWMNRIELKTDSEKCCAKGLM